MAISQFTLSWDGKRGNRPGYDRSKNPLEAEQLFNHFCIQLQERVVTKKGRFGANMQVSIMNDGPVTFSLDF